jgi:hypothetical protein
VSTPTRRRYLATRPRLTRPSIPVCMPPLCRNAAQIPSTGRLRWASWLRAG